MQPGPKLTELTPRWKPDNEAVLAMAAEKHVLAGRAWCFPPWEVLRVGGILRRMGRGMPLPEMGVSAASGMHRTVGGGAVVRRRPPM